MTFLILYGCSAVAAIAERNQQSPSWPCLTPYGNGLPKSPKRDGELDKPSPISDGRFHTSPAGGEPDVLPNPNAPQLSDESSAPNCGSCHLSSSSCASSHVSYEFESPDSNLSIPDEHEVGLKDSPGQVSR